MTARSYRRSVRGTRGFTILETLITTAILVFGLSALALMFSYTARVNINTQQRTTATFLLYEKLEEIRFTPLTDDIWTPGSYVDYATIADIPYMRQWQITNTTPRNITMVVFASRAGSTGRRMELIRAATLVSNTLQ